MISQVFGYWLNQVTTVLAVLARILRIFFSTIPTHVLQKKIYPSNFAFFDQLWSQIYPIWRLISKKTFYSIVGNCLKILNLLSEARLDDAELTKKNEWKLHLNISIFATLARKPKQMWMWPSVGMIKKFHVTLYKMVYKSGRLHAPVRKYSMSKLTNNREILYFWTAVMAKPCDHPGQNC